MIDVPVSQMVDQLSEVVKFFVTLPVVADQVMEVPTITLEDTIPQRAPLRAPQLAEQFELEYSGSLDVTDEIPVWQPYSLLG